MINSFFKRNWLILLGIALGSTGGYLYWLFIGCSNGQCMIASSPINSSLWGAAVGGLALSIFKTKESSKKQKNNE